MWADISGFATVFIISSQKVRNLTENLSEIRDDFCNKDLSEVRKINESLMFPNGHKMWEIA